MKEGRKPEYQEKTPGDELQKMPHTTTRRFKPEARVEPAQLHWWQARKADVLTVTPRVAQITVLQEEGKSLCCSSNRKPEYQEKTPGDELQKMPHTTTRRFKPEARVEPAQLHWWQARKADVLTVTPRVAQITVLREEGKSLCCSSNRKPEYQEKTPGDELQKMPHTTTRRFKPEARVEPAQLHWWQARKADVLTVTPRVAQITVLREEGKSLCCAQSRLDMW